MNAANVIALGSSARLRSRSTEERLPASAVSRTLHSLVPAAHAADINVLDLTHDAVFLRAMDGAIAYWNRAAEKMYGWTADEAAGRASHELLKTVFPGSMDQIEADLMRSGRWEGDLVHTRKDGTQVTVASRWALQRGKASAPNAVVVYEMQAAYADAVAATVAHEIRQPLTAMVTSADAGLRFLDRSMPNLEKAKQAFKRIAADGHRAGAVVQGIRANLRAGDKDRASLDVDELIRETISFLRRDLQKHRIIVHSKPDSALPRVRANRVQLQQVLLNLIANAIDAMAASDEPRVMYVKSEAREGDDVAITIADTGAGIKPADVDRIFNPLFTTKSHGMGMGLAICRAIVEAHAGRLSYSPNTPRGAVFQLTLRCG
jgi:PAS domain S-box-containing protein